MKKIIILVLLIINSVLILKAQIEKAESNGNFGHLSKNYQTEIIQTNDGSFIALLDHNYYSIMKFNAKQQILWKQNFESFKELNSVIQTRDNGYLLVGESRRNKADNESFFFIVKTNNIGKIKWKKKYGEKKSMSNSIKVISDSNDGYIIIGTTNFEGEKNNYRLSQNIWIIKIDEDGKIIWEKTYGNKAYDEIAETIIQTNDGGYAIIATINYFNKPKATLFIKIDRYGNFQWEKIFEGTRVSGIIQDNNDNYIILNHSTLFIFNKKEIISQFMLFEMLRKKERLGEFCSMEFHSIIKTDDNSLVASGYYKCGTLSSTGDPNLFICKIDKYYNLLWTITEGLLKSPITSSLIETKNKDIAVTFSYFSAPNNIFCFMLIKTKIEDIITERINNKMELWKQKGKYEKQLEYDKRVTKQTIQEQREIYKAEVILNMGISYFYNNKNLYSLNYDAENEIFKIKFNLFESIFLNIPNNEAKKFEANFSKLQYSDFDFDIPFNEQLIIKKITVKDTINNKIYFYDISKPYNFNE